MNSRYIKAGAFLSVLLNVLLLGVILGHMFADRPNSRWGHSAGGFQDFLDKLPAEKSAWFLAESKKKRIAHRTRHEALKKLRQEAVNALTAEPFDSALFKQKLIELNEVRGGLKHGHTLVIVQLAEKLSQSERAELSRHLLREIDFKRKRPNNKNL